MALSVFLVHQAGASVPAGAADEDRTTSLADVPFPGLSAFPFIPEVLLAARVNSAVAS
jgi:hypothetical protein